MNQLDSRPKGITVVDVARDIRQARMTTGLSQQRFCEVCRTFEPRSITFGRRDLSKYENGENVPPADKYIKILMVARNLHQKSKQPFKNK